MRIMITGGAGFIGSHFVREICSGNFPGYTEVLVLDKFTYAGRMANLENIPTDRFRLIKGDICDEALVKKSIKNVDVVVNFAAESHVDKSISDSKPFVDTNFLGVQNLLDAALKNNVTKYLQVSTDEVYGSIAAGSWDEWSPLQPNSPYSASKAAADLLVYSYFKTYGLNTSITRACNNYGPFQLPEKLIPNFITRLLDNQDVPVYGDGSNVREWIHVLDHCRGIYDVSLAGEPGAVYNIGSGVEMTNLELTLKILDIMKLDSSKIRYVEDRLGHDLRYSLNFSKISNVFNFKPSIDFEVGLTETINWYTQFKDTF